MHYKHILVALMVFTSMMTMAQTDTVVFPKTLYVYQSDGLLSEYLELDDMFLVSESSEYLSKEDTPRVDTLFIKKVLDHEHYVIQRSGSDRLGVMSRKEVVKDSIYSMTPLYEGTQIETVISKYQNRETPEWASLMSRQFFSEAMLNKLKQAPGLDEITRKDLLTSLDWRKDISKELKAYAEEHPDRPYHLTRMVANYRDQRLVLLGYNPYKRVRYNWEKQFEGDEEVMKALTEPISFD